MSSHNKIKHPPFCLNCHYPLAEFDKMCSQCGQKPTDGKTTMHDLMHEFVHTLFHLDGKFFWTLKHVFIPGRLTLEFFKGHHKRYAHPVQLFLVLGAFTFGLLATSAKNKNEEEKKFQKEEGLFRKQVYMDLDSLKHTLPDYKNREIAKAIDTLLLKGYGYGGNINENAEILETWLKDRIAIDSLTKVLKVGMSDSIQMAKQDAPKINDLHEKLNDLRGNLAEKKEEIEVDSVAAIKVLERMKLGSLRLDFLPKGAVRFNVDSKDLIKLIEESKKMPNKETHLFTHDSSSFNLSKFRYKIAEIDAYKYSENELIEKYKIEGFWNQMIFKQSIKFKKSGAEDLKHYIFSKFIWLTILIIFPMAAFYMLLYRRQKRFYVEHFVFLMHYCIMGFGLVSIYMFLKIAHFDTVANVYGLLLAFYLYVLAMPLAMKNFYNQSWGKTIAKFLIAGTVFFIVALLVFILGTAVSFALF
jgi:Protein of unknown function (DUF3667)